jgi:hypothetical protein
VITRGCSLTYAAVVALPNWLGAWLAMRARRGGAGLAATVALWQNLIVGLAIAVFVVIASWSTHLREAPGAIRSPRPR